MIRIKEKKKRKETTDYTDITDGNRQNAMLCLFYPWNPWFLWLFPQTTDQELVRPRLENGFLGLYPDHPVILSKTITP